MRSTLVGAFIDLSLKSTNIAVNFGCGLLFLCIACQRIEPDVSKRI